MMRDYQLEICQKVREAFGKYRSVMMQMPTGTGKTVVLTELVKQFFLQHRPSSGQQSNGPQSPCDVLIVAHRMELIEQTGEHLQRYGIDYGLIVGGGEKTGEMKPVMVASIQTLAKRLCLQAGKEGGTLFPALTPRFVVIDEAHHAVAKSYRLLWEAWPEARFLGLTATPCRLSGEGFGDLFEVLVASWNIREFMAEGWLSPFDYYSVRPESEEQVLIDSLQKRGADGDFQVKELREALDVGPSIERLFDTFCRLARNKKGIVYAIDIAHAEHIAAFYSAQGVRAVALSAKTPKAERQAAVGAFKAGPEIQVLVSVDLFSEGFDCPDVEFVQLARPTLSLAKYMQMVGRGLRPCKGKAFCTIIDNVGLYRTFGLPSVDRDWEWYFRGRALPPGLSGLRNAPRLGLGENALSDENDSDVVRIVLHGEIKAQLQAAGRTGFLRKKRGKAWVWIDETNGIVFDRHPQVVNFQAIELSTADGETFYPRIRSKWMDAKLGIGRKALETQAGEGIGWARLYVSMAWPHKVLRLLSVEADQTRMYEDEEGNVFLQQDLDHAPVCVGSEAESMAFKAQCEEAQRTWSELTQSERLFLKKDNVRGGWLLPEGWEKKREIINGKESGRFFRITCQGDGASGGNKVFWVDWTTGFVLHKRPVLRKRGFVELLYEGEVVFILNIHEERFIPYHNWEIRADERICTIGNKMYFSNNKNGTALRIKKRSGDFQMFVVQEAFDMEKFKAGTLRNLMVINKWGAELEMREIPPSRR